MINSGMAVGVVICCGRLVMTTGHCLDRCRQALFIAEGDVEEARADLLAAAYAPAHGFGFVLH